MTISGSATITNSVPTNAGNEDDALTQIPIVSPIDRKCNAEGMLLALMAELSIPFAQAPKLIEWAQASVIDIKVHILYIYIYIYIIFLLFTYKLKIMMTKS